MISKDDASDLQSLIARAQECNKRLQIVQWEVTKAESDLNSLIYTLQQAPKLQVTPEPLTLPPYIPALPYDDTNVPF